MSRTVPTALLAVLPWLVGQQALAAEVYVNGVNVEGLVAHHFSRVDVRIDEKGNVHIDAPGYKVQRVTLPPESGKGPTRPEGVITRRYFLLTEASVQAPLWEVEVVLNGKLLRSVASKDDPLLLDVTSSLRPGPNELLLRARRVPGAGGPERTFKVLLGEGRAAQGQVTIDAAVVSFQRTGAETDDVTQSYTVTTR